MLLNTLETKKVVTALVVVAMIFGALFAFTTVKAYALTEAQIQSILSLLSSFGSDQTTIDNVNASLRGQATSGTGSTGSATACTFTRALTLESEGADVKCLQDYLTSTGHFTFSGGSTGYFGSVTQTAVAAWQAANGVSPAVGYFGSISQAKYTAVAGTTGGTTGGGTTTPAPTGTGLSVSSASQPAASLAPDSAARVPFTKFTVTAGSDGAVVLDSVVVERVGLAANASFAGVVLLDSNGVQIGNAKTLNSNNQATIGESVTVPAGQSMTFTVAGNMASDNTDRAGQVAGLNVVAVNTTAAVSGSLPISGTQHTINSTLTIGSASMSVSSFDPNSAQSKEIGTTGVRVAGVQLTAGSAEDVRIRNIRWNQTGSAGKTDITNVVTVVEGVEYPTTISSDGKFYTANFGSGVLVGKGNNVDIYVKVDIVGGSNRTVIMDIDKATDIYVTGETFSYGITATQSQDGTVATTSSVFTSGTPFFDNATMTISAGSASTIQKSAAVPAQNIAVNVSNQPLGAFETNIKGEAINISGMTFTVASTTGSGTGLLTNVSIVDQNGSVVAGPVDATYTDATTQTLTFTDSMTIPTGKMVYTVKGKVASNIGNGGTYIVSVTPTNWSSPTGNVTGDAITISQTVFTLNTMTVKSAALAITISSSPVAQNITSGVQGFTFANVQLDASASGEDVRFSSIPLQLTYTIMEVTQVTACQLFDGVTALNTGSNVVDPSGTSPASNVFTFDESLTITKGTVKSLALKCNISSGTEADDSLSWGIAASPAITVTGVTSSGNVAEDVTASVGQTMTVQAVSLAVSVDSSSPSYTIAAAGSTGVTAGVVKFRATNETVNLQKVGLTLTATSGSGNSSSDLVQVSLWDGATKVGTATFTGGNTSATSTLSSTVSLPKDTDKTLTVKVDLADVGTSQPATNGNLIKVDPLNVEGVGASSGTTVKANATAGVAGVRLMNSYPTVALSSLSSSGVSDGRLMRFAVTANLAGSVGLHNLTFQIATTSATVTDVGLYGYTDSSFSQAMSGQGTAGIIDEVLATTTPRTVATCLTTGGSTCVDNAANLQLNIVPTTSQITIPAGETRYFELRGSVSGTATTYSVVTKMLSDTAFATSTAATANASYNFVWNANSTSTAGFTDMDWTTGYGVPGLPSSGLIQTRSN